MTAPDRHVESTCFLSLEPQWDRSGHLKGFTVANVRQTKPTRGGRGAGVVTMRLHVRMPASAFEPLAPEVEITVPDGSYDIVPEVTVDAGGDE